MTARLIMKLDVAERAECGAGALLFRFRHPMRPELPGWAPGAHVDLRLPDGRTRQYSLCGDPQDREFYQIVVQQEAAGRGGSAWVHATLRPGMRVPVSAPRNNFPLVAAARHVLVAGGIGITPLAAMARHLAGQGADFTLHVCARGPDAPLLDDLRAVCGPRLVTWFAADGRRFSPALLGPPRPGTLVYACGPQRLLDAVMAQMGQDGWPPQALHQEVFQPTLDENFKPEPFLVHLAQSGETLLVPAETTLLEVLRAHGLPMPSSCELGVCGACICAYRDGVVIHRDAVLGLAARQDRMTPCVSRARNAVTLDL